MGGIFFHFVMLEAMMKSRTRCVLLAAAVCSIVSLSQAVQDASADQRTARRNFLQSTFGVPGNLELYVPQADVITHYWRDWTGWHVGTDKLVYPCPDIKCA